MRGAGCWRWRRTLATVPASLQTGAVRELLQQHVLVRAADGAIGIDTPGLMPRR
jgi:hypothetical protein